MLSTKMVLPTGPRAKREIVETPPVAATVPLRLEWFDGGVGTVRLTVIDLDDLTQEIALDGQTIGFIGRAHGVFVALTGTRLDRAEECSQSLLWDKSAAILVALSGHRPEREESDRGRGASVPTAGHNDGGTDQLQTQSRPRVPEVSW
jgi:hypothetical protein